MAVFQTHISKFSEMGVELNFLIFFSYAHPQQKGLQGPWLKGLRRAVLKKNTHNNIFDQGVSIKVNASGN